MPPHDLVFQCRTRRGRGCPPASGADPTRGGGAEDAGESGQGGALMEMRISWRNVLAEDIEVGPRS
jgi:hypothetical protein